MWDIFWASTDYARPSAEQFSPSTLATFLMSGLVPRRPKIQSMPLSSRSVIGSGSTKCPLTWNAICVSANVRVCAEPAGADRRALRAESRRANAMHSRIAAKSAGNTDCGPCAAGQLERRVEPQMIEDAGAFVAAANR